MKILLAIVGFLLVAAFGVSLFMALWGEFRNPVRGSGKTPYPMSLWMGRGDE